MNSDMTRPDSRFVPAGMPVRSCEEAPARSTDELAAHEQAVDAILDDCCLSIGQGVGLRATLDFDAVVYFRNTFRPKFLAAMRQFGNRWLDDRAVVTAVGWMLGERAVRYANGAPSIDLDAMRKASADVQRYCQLHAARRNRTSDHGSSEASTARIAGYWCTWDPEP